jgi:hypothetical protein
MELANIHPRPPALRLFDAGMGDGGPARTMRAMASRRCRSTSWARRSPRGVRLVEKMPDRLFEHPATGW